MMQVFAFLIQMKYKGAFFEKGRLTDISAFAPATHQSDPPGAYVNNFLFSPQEC